MGDFRLVVEAAGGHGCNRTAKTGDEAPGCGQETCPDCITARYITELKRAGIHPSLALYTHWPAAMHEHLLFDAGEGKQKCLRCNAVEDLNDPCEEGRPYTADREVVDDLTEHRVRYPSTMRATPFRVKGCF